MKTIERIIHEMRCLETDLREVTLQVDAEFQAERLRRITDSLSHAVFDTESTKTKDGPRTNIHGGGTGEDEG